MSSQAKEATPTRVGHLIYGPDGHRRWAYLRKGSLDHNALKESYMRSYAVVEKLVDWSLSPQGHVDELTLFYLLERNMHRAPEHSQILGEAIRYWITKLCASDVVRDLDLRIDIAGERDAEFYKEFGSEINPAIESVKSHKGKKIHILAPYDGSVELQRALLRCKEKNLEPTFANLSQNWSIPPVDLFLRTGQPFGFNNLSDYYPGIERARLISTPTYPQELTKTEFDGIIRQFLALKDSIKRVLASENATSY